MANPLSVLSQQESELASTLLSFEDSTTLIQPTQFSVANEIIHSMDQVSDNNSADISTQSSPLRNISIHGNQGLRRVQGSGYHDGSAFSGDGFPKTDGLPNWTNAN